MGIPLVLDAGTDTDIFDGKFFDAPVLRNSPVGDGEFFLRGSPGGKQNLIKIEAM